MRTFTGTEDLRNTVPGKGETLPVEPSVMREATCPFCREALRGDASKCPHCGSEQPWVAELRKGRSTRRLKNILLCVMGLVLVALAWVSWLSSERDKKNAQDSSAFAVQQASFINAAPPGDRMLCQTMAMRGYDENEVYCLTQLQDRPQRRSLLASFHLKDIAKHH